MAARILQAGFDLTVFNRSQSKMAPFVDAGAESGISIADAARDADVAVPSLVHDHSVLGMVNGELSQAMKPGARSICGTTTGSPDCADDLTRIHKQAGSVMGLPAAAAGELITFIAGDAEACETMKPICSAYARVVDRISYRHAVANSMKLCVNDFAVALLELMGEVYAFAECSGAPIEEVGVFSITPLPLLSSKCTRPKSGPATSTAKRVRHGGRPEGCDTDARRA